MSLLVVGGRRSSAGISVGSRPAEHRPLFPPGGGQHRAVELDDTTGDGDRVFGVRAAEMPLPEESIDA